MDEVQVAEFRTNFGKLSAPTRVVRYGRTVGDWYPGGHECTQASASAQSDEQTEEITRLKRQLAERTRRIAELEERAAAYQQPSLGTSSVRPPTIDDDLAAREAHRLVEQAKARAASKAEDEQRRAWLRRMVTPQKGRGGGE